MLPLNLLGCNCFFHFLEISGPNRAFSSNVGVHSRYCLIDGHKILEGEVARNPPKACPDGLASQRACGRALGTSPEPGGMSLEKQPWFSECLPCAGPSARVAVMLGGGVECL